MAARSTDLRPHPSPRLDADIHVHSRHQEDWFACGPRQLLDLATDLYAIDVREIYIEQNPVCLRGKRGVKPIDETASDGLLND
jgi:hypothetical protein